MRGRENSEIEEFSKVEVETRGEELHAMIFVTEFNT